MIEIHKGSSRIVLLIGQYAFKFPYFRFRLNGWVCGLGGMIANINERRFSHLNHWFSPTLFSVWGGFMNVQKRARPLTPDEFKRHRRSIPSRLYADLVEKKPCSFGWIDGKIYTIDYGR